MSTPEGRNLVYIPEGAGLDSSVVLRQLLTVLDAASKGNHSAAPYSGVRDLPEGSQTDVDFQIVASPEGVHEEGSNNEV